jgi:branched-chain amino acid transport system permease protein
MLTVLVTGVALGSIYAGVALVYNLMFSTTRVLSITAGHACMLGGVFGAYFVKELGLPVVPGLLATLCVGAACGWVTVVIGIRRILGRSDQHLWILSTLALATIIQQSVGLWWGTEPKQFPRLVPQDFSAGLGDQKFWLPAIAAVAVVASLEVLYRRTLYGKLFLAVSEDAFAALARGVAVRQVRAASYALAGAVGALIGFAAGQLTFAYFALGLTLTLNGFIALAVGGLGSNLGALVGGLILGLISASTTYFFGGEYQNTISTSILIAILLLKPEGLFGGKAVRQV